MIEVWRGRDGLCGRRHLRPERRERGLEMGCGGVEGRSKWGEDGDGKREGGMEI